MDTYLGLIFSENKIWFILMILVVPIIHDFHFYCIHRLIHIPILYKWVHSVHHKSVNPSPWSSLSMHPVEHILYFGTVFWHFLLPSNPIIALYQLHFAGFGAVPGHIGLIKLKYHRKKHLILMHICTTFIINTLTLIMVVMG